MGGKSKAKLVQFDFLQDNQVGLIEDQLVGVDSSALCFYAQVCHCNSNIYRRRLVA